MNGADDKSCGALALPRREHLVAIRVLPQRIGSSFSAAPLITMTLTTMGKHFSRNPRTAAEVEAYAAAMADMFCAYLIGVLLLLFLIKI